MVINANSPCGYVTAGTMAIAFWLMIKSGHRLRKPLLAQSITLLAKPWVHMWGFSGLTAPEPVLSRTAIANLRYVGAGIMVTQAGVVVVKDTKWMGPLLPQ